MWEGFQMYDSFEEAQGENPIWETPVSDLWAKDESSARVNISFSELQTTSQIPSSYTSFYLTFYLILPNIFLILPHFTLQNGLNLPKFWPFARIQLQCFMQLRYKILTSTLEA